VAWLDALRGRAAVPFAMRVDGSALDEWARTIAGAVDRPAADGAIVPTFQGIEVTPAVVGRTVDAAALRRALLASGTLGDRDIALQVHETYPAVDRSGIRDAAAKAVAATTELAIVAGDRTASEDAAGLATLLVIQRDGAAPDELDALPAGAPAPATRYGHHVRFEQPRGAQWVSRHANITTGAMQFNDLVLAPGESFSFWDRLGPVSVDRGYAFAGAIIEGRSDENVIGGGLCQVSTTLFNAVARAGYEIVERHAHG